MKTICKTDETTASFIITDLEPEYHGAARDLYYRPIEGGFAKNFPKDTPHLDQIFRDFEAHAEEMILQMAKVRAIPWEKALSAFLEIVKDEKIGWWLCGSGALAVRGVNVIPRDIDLIVDDADVEKLGMLLLDHLVEPVVSSLDWIANWFGRAFIHARVEFIASVFEWVDTPRVSDFGPTATKLLEVVTWRGYEITVPPLRLQLEVSERRGLTDRVEKIKKHQLDKITILGLHAWVFNFSGIWRTEERAR